MPKRSGNDKSTFKVCKFVDYAPNVFLKIRHIFIYCTLLCAFTTYIFQETLNLGEVLAEGLPLIFGLIYFSIIVK